MLKHVLSDDSIKTALVFTRTKHGADKLVKFLIKSGIKAEAIHGNKSQGARQVALRNFKNRSTRVLVATDIAARGIDIDDLTHVSTTNFQKYLKPMYTVSDVQVEPATVVMRCRFAITKRKHC